MSPKWEFKKADPEHPWADVLPLDDEQPHQHHTFEASCACHCKPRVHQQDPDGNSMAYPIVVHMAFDGRHIVEQAEALLTDG